MPTLDLRLLRKELEVEEINLRLRMPLPSDDNWIPEMESLRSPTTRTLDNIIKNKNHAAVIKHHLDAVDSERGEFQATIDVAEALTYEPIADNYSQGIDVPLGDNTVKFVLPRDALNGSMLPQIGGKTAILDRWGLRSTPKEDPGALVHEIPDASKSKPLSALMAEQKSLIQKIEKDRPAYVQMLSEHERWQKKRQVVLDAVLEPRP